MTFPSPLYAPDTPSGGSSSDSGDAASNSGSDRPQNQPRHASAFVAPTGVPGDSDDRPLPLHPTRPETPDEWADLWRTLCMPLFDEEADYVNLRRFVDDVEFDVRADGTAGGTAYLILKLPSLFRRLDEVCSTQGWSLTLEPSSSSLTAVHLDIWDVRRTGLSQASEPYRILQEGATRAAGLFGIPTRLAAWRPVAVEYAHLARGQRPNLDRILEEHGVLQTLGHPDENRRL